jgi:hypothetical protein
MSAITTKQGARAAKRMQASRGAPAPLGTQASRGAPAPLGTQAPKRTQRQAGVGLWSGLLAVCVVVAAVAAAAAATTAAPAAAVSTPAAAASASSVTPAPSSSRVIQYRGPMPLLPDSANNGEVKLTFELYRSPTGGVPVWTETRTVVAHDRFVEVDLGQVEPLPDEAFESPFRFLSIWHAAVEFKPRKQVVSVAYLAAKPEEYAAGQAGVVSTGRLTAAAYADAGSGGMTAGVAPATAGGTTSGTGGTTVGGVGGVGGGLAGGSMSGSVGDVAGGTAGTAASGAMLSGADSGSASPQPPPAPLGSTVDVGGFAIERNPRSPTTWLQAERAAAQLGARLPTFQEWYAAVDGPARAQLEQVTGHYEWVIPWVYDPQIHSRMEELYRGKPVACYYNELSPQHDYPYRLVAIRAR